MLNTYQLLSLCLVCSCIPLYVCLCLFSVLFLSFACRLGLGWVREDFSTPSRALRILLPWPPVIKLSSKALIWGEVIPAKDSSRIAKTQTEGAINYDGDAVHWKVQRVSNKTFILQRVVAEIFMVCWFCPRTQTHTLRVAEIFRMMRKRSVLLLLTITATLARTAEVFVKP